MRFYIRLLCLSFFIGVCIVFSVTGSVIAQTNPQPASITCGDVLNTEMTPGTPYQDVILAIQAGTTIDLTITPLGPSFNPFFFLLDSGGSETLRMNTNSGGVAEELIGYVLSSSNSSIRVMGAPIDYVDIVPSKDLPTFMEYIARDIRDNRIYWRGDLNNVGVNYGAFTVSVECDGSSTTSDNNITPTPVFSGVGFPGLASVDFSNVAKIPLPTGIAMAGAVTPNGGEILGYMLDGNAGDILALSFTRLSGNLNLGLAVMSPDNKVVFQASLVTSSELTTKVTLPSAGTYTIGVYRIDLMPPDAPEATAFQVQGTLNP